MADMEKGKCILALAAIPAALASLLAAGGDLWAMGILPHLLRADAPRLAKEDLVVRGFVNVPQTLMNLDVSKHSPVFAQVTARLDLPDARDKKAVHDRMPFIADLSLSTSGRASP